MFVDTPASGMCAGNRPGAETELMWRAGTKRPTLLRWKTLSEASRIAPCQDTIELVSRCVHEVKRPDMFREQPAKFVFGDCIHIIEIVAGLEHLGHVAEYLDFATLHFELGEPDPFQTHLIARFQKSQIVAGVENFLKELKKDGLIVAGASSATKKGKPLLSISKKTPFAATISVLSSNSSFYYPFLQLKRMLNIS